MDLRTYLAVKMANYLIYGYGHIETYDECSNSEYSGDTLREENSPDITGVKCPSYEVFIFPFIDPKDGQIRRLINCEADPVTQRENIPGDEDIKLLCQEYRMTPAPRKVLEPETVSSSQSDPANSQGTAA